MKRRSVLGFIRLPVITAALVLTYALPVSADTFYYSPPVSKFTQPLRGVGATGIPVAVSDGISKWCCGFDAAHYTIDVNQYTDTLHPDLGGPTTFWGYNPRNALGVIGVPTQKYLGGIIIAQRGKPVQITFNNNLPPTHILPVDRTIMGAMGGAEGPDNRIVTHLHGGLVPWISDGGPYAWWDPQGDHGPSWKNNVVKNPVSKNQAEFYYPNDQSARLMWYHDHAVGTTRINAYGGIASAYIIRDNFESCILVNQLGLPKFIENGGRELPLVIQDKIFQNANALDPAFPGKKGAGNLWYPYIYDPDRWTLLNTGTPPPVPSVVAEMFGDTMLVNGVPYPNASVDPRHYRLRILNACQARFLNLQLYEALADGVTPDFTKPGPDWLVIGTEGGFLANPVIVPSAPLQFIQAPGALDRMVDPTKAGGSLITAPAERWDVVVDFNGKSGKKYILCNDAPGPYPMGDQRNDYPRSGAPNGNTQIIMRFDIKPESGVAAEPKFQITPDTQLAGNLQSGIDHPLAGIIPNIPACSNNWGGTPDVALPIPTRSGIKVRLLTLNETFDGFGRLTQMEGTNIATGIVPPPVPPLTSDFSKSYIAPATEVVKAGSTEVWQIINLTGDAHPIHIHLVNAQLLSRRPFDVGTYTNTTVGQPAKLVYVGQPRGADPTEMGWKETFKMFPGDVTTIIMQFNLPKTPFAVPFSDRAALGVKGYEYVWHCHILEHEEHDMMRPLVVVP